MPDLPENQEWQQVEHGVPWFDALRGLLAEIDAFKAARAELAREMRRRLEREIVGYHRPAELDDPDRRAAP